MAPSRFEAQVPSGTTGLAFSSSDEARAFLQQRLALYAKVACLFIAVYYVLSNASQLLQGRITALGLVTEGDNLVRVLSVPGWAFVWWTCRGKPKSATWLKTLDVTACFIYCTLVSVGVWVGRDNSVLSLVGTMPLTYAILVRAVLVPSPPLRTLWISGLCFSPSIVSVGIIWGYHWQESMGEAPSVALYVLRGLLTISIATVISTVIYGLQRQVQKARRLGQYHLEEKIGAGGMGEVYKASHAMLRRPTAVKLLRADMTGEESILRFEREVQLTAQLTHPNTIAVYDYGRTPAGTFYYAMEFLSGIDLSQLVGLYGPQPPGRVVAILEQVCGSLAEAHSVGLVHRDIKPANIILCQRGLQSDVAKVVDFGLVRDLEQSSGSTLSGSHVVTGTPLYMSPEAIRSPQDVDERSDLYGVGAVGYYLISGQPLFDTENVAEICAHQLQTVPPTPSERLGRSVPADLEGIILRCLAKDPSERFASATEMADALMECADRSDWNEDRASLWWTEHFKTTVKPVDPEAPTVVDRQSVSTGGETIDIDTEARI